MSEKTKKKANSPKKNHKKKQPLIPMWGKVLLALFFIVVITSSVALGLFFSTLKNLDTVKLNKDQLGITSREELKGYSSYSKIKNIALFGIDSEDGAGRSDSIMIATIDPVHDKLKITSIMRDSYVNIDDYGYTKLNHAYAYGGPELSIKTINQSFGLNIDDFAAVDFNSLPKIIDALGGITIDITDEEVEYINNYINDLNEKNYTGSPLISSAGEQAVDGTQALAYTRIRYTAGGDFERTRRQRTVLSKLFSKALETSPTQYLSVTNQLLPYVRTSMDANKILDLATKVAKMGGGTLEQERFPRDSYASNQLIDGVSYYVFDEAATKKQIMDYIYDDKLND
ncbi:MAG: LCP family protein [Clostridium sp.]|uniref:LCP family protein n=1 Tax=Clostridium sp. TaxID=1506 RepID=UPI0025B7E602|nr:LCP family protein [Clostridium sp.]MCF0149644.1 LCP family protein [Clostridium sp.]